MYWTGNHVQREEGDNQISHAALEFLISSMLDQYDGNTMRC